MYDPERNRQYIYRASFYLCIKVNILVTKNRSTGKMETVILDDGNHHCIACLTRLILIEFCPALAASAVRSRLDKSQLI